MTVLLGCITWLADFTGGTDLAGMLVKAGMRTVQLIGVPQGPPPGDVDAVVIALKSHECAGRQTGESLTALASAATSRMPPVLLQVLLHVRLHAARRWSHGRSADAGAGHGLHDHACRDFPPTGAPSTR